MLLGFGAPCQLRLLAGPEHGRPIPLADIGPDSEQFRSAQGVVIGIVSKNSILLVEYTVVSIRDRGLPLYEAVLEACRPIVMTTFAMIAGMLPIALGFGADSSFRQPMAVAAIGGLLSSTALSLLVVPVVFTYVDGFERWLHTVWHRKSSLPHSGRAARKCNLQPIGGLVMIKRFGVLWGILFLLGGILGFVPGITRDEMFLGVFMVNAPHSILHMVSGGIFLVASLIGARAVRAWFLIFGSFYAALSAIGVLLLATE